jgi:hypothetical protein
MLMPIAFFTVVAGLAAHEVEPITAAHHGRIDGDLLVWSSTVDLGAIGTTNALWVALLHPLPEGAHIEGANAIRSEDGSIEAIEFAGADAGTGDMLRQVRSFVVSVPFRAGGDRVPAPLFGASVERLSFAGLRFEPDPGLGVRAHLGYHADDAIERGDRHLVERRLGIAASSGCTYLSPTPALVADGLLGHLVVVAAERQRLAFGALAMTALLVGLGLLAWRRLRGAVEEERVDKVLGGELDFL